MPKSTYPNPDAARDFPRNTCAASRHVQLMGEALRDGKPYLMLQEDPKECAASMLATVEALYRARTDLAKQTPAGPRPHEAGMTIDEMARRGAAKVLWLVEMRRTREHKWKTSGTFETRRSARAKAFAVRSLYGRGNTRVVRREKVGG